MRFKRVYIEISNICNLSCSFCSPVTRPLRIMSVTEFEHILRQVAPFTDYVYFHVKGEPLIHPHVGELFDLCATALPDKCMQVNLTTNGVLLGEMGTMLLDKPALRQINISLHSFTAQEDISFERYLSDCIDFAKHANECDKYVVLRLWNLQKDGGVDAATTEIIRRVQAEFHPKVDLLEALQKNRSIQLASRVFISWEREFDWPSMTLPELSDEGICYGMRALIGILADGTVVPCCLDADGIVDLGNVLEQPFADILRTRRAKRIADSFTNRKVAEALCRRCTYRTRFD